MTLDQAIFGVWIGGFVGGFCVALLIFRRWK